MIHIFIGTKAQYVKTAPVLKELERRGITYNLIDSGQHAAISKGYRQYFQIKEPDRYLRQADSDIKTVWALCTWLFKFFLQITFKPKNVFQNLFQGHTGICIIHGDTPTTLLSVLAAKRIGIKVIHLESGLRSYNIFHPFPEEIIRILTMRLSDYLFAPSQWAFDNLEKMNIKGTPFLVCGNTNIDVLRLAQEQDYPLPKGLSRDVKFAVFSIHRAETILNKKRLRKIVDLVKLVAQKYDVLFCTHPPTKKQLEKYNFLFSLESTNHVHLIDLLPYPEFIHVIQQAYFIVTDGGSVQEESYFLNIPCLLMRYRTERTEGLKQNVCVSEFDPSKIKHFLDHIESFRTSDYQETGQSPSSDIVNILLREFPQEATH